MSYFTTGGSIKRPLFPTDAVANVFQAEGVHSVFTLLTSESESVLIKKSTFLPLSSNSNIMKLHKSVVPVIFLPSSLIMMFAFGRRKTYLKLLLPLFMVGFRQADLLLRVKTYFNSPGEQMTCHYSYRPCCLHWAFWFVCFCFVCFMRGEKGETVTDPWIFI